MDDILFGMNCSWGIVLLMFEMEVCDESFGFFLYVVDSGYIDVFGVLFVVGRNFILNDVEDIEVVFIFNELVVKMIFGEEDLINCMINFFDNLIWIVGVVVDVCYLVFEEGLGYEVYMLFI